MIMNFFYKFNHCKSANLLNIVVTDTFEFCMESVEIDMASEFKSIVDFVAT